MQIQGEGKQAQKKQISQMNWKKRGTTTWKIFQQNYLFRNKGSEWGNLVSKGESRNTSLLWSSSNGGEVYLQELLWSS